MLPRWSRVLLLVATLGSCSGPSYSPLTVTSPDPRLTISDRHRVWDAILHSRRGRVAIDSTTTMFPEVLMVEKGALSDTAEATWLASLFDNPRRIDGYCTKASACECQHSALVPTIYLTLKQPTLWRPDTATAVIELDELYASVTPQAVLAGEVTWWIGTRPVQYFVAKGDSSWTVIPTPSDPGPMPQWVSDGICNK
jgi:hypothetical protein